MMGSVQKIGTLSVFCMVSIMGGGALFPSATAVTMKPISEYASAHQATFQEVGQLIQAHDRDAPAQAMRDVQGVRVVDLAAAVAGPASEALVTTGPLLVIEGARALYHDPANGQLAAFDDRGNLQWFYDASAPEARIGAMSVEPATLKPDMFGVVLLPTVISGAPLIAAERIVTENLVFPEGADGEDARSLLALANRMLLTTAGHPHDRAIWTRGKYLAEFFNGVEFTADITFQRNFTPFSCTFQFSQGEALARMEWNFDQKFFYIKQGDTVHNFEYDAQQRLRIYYKETPEAVTSIHWGADGQIKKTGYRDARLPMGGTIPPGALKVTDYIPAEYGANGTMISPARPLPPGKTGSQYAVEEYVSKIEAETLRKLDETNPAESQP